MRNVWQKQMQFSWITSNRNCMSAVTRRDAFRCCSHRIDVWFTIIASVSSYCRNLQHRIHHSAPAGCIYILHNTIIFCAFAIASRPNLVASVRFGVSTCVAQFRICFGAYLHIFRVRPIGLSHRLHTTCTHPVFPQQTQLSVLRHRISHLCAQLYEMLEIADTATRK